MFSDRKHHIIVLCSQNFPAFSSIILCSTPSVFSSLSGWSLWDISLRTHGAFVPQAPENKPHLSRGRDTHKQTQVLQSFYSWSEKKRIPLIYFLLEDFHAISYTSVLFLQARHYRFFMHWSILRFWDIWVFIKCCFRLVERKHFIALYVFACVDFNYNTYR